MAINISTNLFYQCNAAINHIHSTNTICRDVGTPPSNTLLHFSLVLLKEQFMKNNNLFDEFSVVKLI